MRLQERRSKPVGWALDHLVEAAFGLVALGWLVYVLPATSRFSYFADDLLYLEQIGSAGGLFEPYAGHLSVVILSIYHASAEVGDLDYTPIMLAGVLAYVAGPISYIATTRRHLGPSLAAVLALSLLWHEGMRLRPSVLNHFLTLVGAVICAAGLNRGRRADGLVAAGLTLALCSTGGGLVVAGTCLLHNLLVRPPLRRWLVALVPAVLWVGWWLLVADAASASSPWPAGAGDAARFVRDLWLSPFYAAGFGNRFVAYALLGAFFVHGFSQVRRGLGAGANFLAWSAAMVALGVVLVQGRGIQADAGVFRYAHLSMGFALLALVPRQPIDWPKPGWLGDRRELVAPVAAVLVLVFGGVAALNARGWLQDYDRRNADLGREADGTLLVVGLGDDVVPDSTAVPFFGFVGQLGSAGRLRAIIDRYGSPFEATTATADRVLVDLEIVRARVGGRSPHHGCRPLTVPLRVPGVAAYFEPSGLVDRPDGAREGRPRTEPLTLWSSNAFTVEVRRYGDAWVQLADVPAGRNVVLTLPALSTERPWEVRADGACDVRAQA